MLQTLNVSQKNKPNALNPLPWRIVGDECVGLFKIVSVCAYINKLGFTLDKIYDAINVLIYTSSY